MNRLIPILLLTTMTISAQIVGNESFNSLDGLKIGEIEFVNSSVPNIFCGASDEAVVSFSTEENASGGGGCIKIVNTSIYRSVVVFHLQQLPKGNYEVSAMVRLGSSEAEYLSIRFGKSPYHSSHFDNEGVRHPKTIGMAEANIFAGVNAYPNQWFKISVEIREDSLPVHHIYWKDGLKSYLETHSINIPSPPESILYIDNISLIEINL